MAYTIGNGCSTCHYCYRSCPVDAISFVDKTYAIDGAVCISCGKCEEVCPSGIIYDPEVQARKKVVIPREEAYDLIVLGGGGSGLVAAVRFKELTGRKVVVLEKGKKAGGNTTLAHNFLTRYSKRHEAMGMPDLRDEAIKSIITHDPDLSAPLLRKAIYAQTDVLDWLLDMGELDEHMTMVDLRERGNRMGPFVHTPGFLDFPKRIANVDSTDHSMGPGWMGTYVIDKMMEKCQELDVEVLTEYQATSLNMAIDGSFESVEVETPFGPLTIKGDHCLIATGGFARHKQRMQKLEPTFYEDEAVHTFTVASNTGDAIDMAEAIGAKMDFEHIKIPMFGPVHHPYSFPVLRLAGSPRAIMVSLEGRRFQNEGLPPSMSFKGPLENLPGKVAYAVFDAQTMDVMGEELIDSALHDETMYQCLIHWKEELAYEATLGKPVWKADSLEALANLTGINVEGLLSEVDKYNDYCLRGRDDDFDKQESFLNPIAQGPFYAVFLSRFNEGAEGGIVNDDDLRVVKSDGGTFKGLYVAGDCCRGVLKQSDEGGKMGEFPWAMASGFMAGETVADHYLSSIISISK